MSTIFSPVSSEKKEAASGHGFGTLPVFLAGISTILGAIMFLRFGYAVGNVGVIGAFFIIVLGHLVTVPTALSLAEIATNRRVEGGGEYFIISRSFGVTIGGVIGISLYLSQAISVAFYMIAFGEAFRPIAPMISDFLGFPFDARMVSIPGTVGLLALVLTRGADLGVKMLYVVVTTLIASLVLFFLGGQVEGFDPQFFRFNSTIADADPFFIVFAIVFPAFTGMTAGVGLSGDLANPRKSIPAGTILATVTGFVVYLAIVWKLASSAPADLLANDQLIMQDIALWGPIIPIGLGAATLSSAIGSILVAPRTLQALGADETIPINPLNKLMAAGIGSVNEPRNATILTGIIALFIVVLGNVDFVARIISMFFMVTYGSLCAISFFEHFAARPSYRPSFKSRWYISLFGALMCLLMMFQMDPLYAILAIVFMSGLYAYTRYKKGEDADDLASMFEGVMTQLTRKMHIRLQLKNEGAAQRDEWRPSVIMVNNRTFDRNAPLTFMRWLCHRQGFGTYLHFIDGRLDKASYVESRLVKKKLIELARAQDSPVYMDTIVSPSMTSALAQSLQVPGVSGISNNTAFFEFSIHDDLQVREEIVNSCKFAASTDMTLMVLRHGDLNFGERKKIFAWITWNDHENTNMMILLSYILVGHPDWHNASVRVFIAVPEGEMEEQREKFSNLITEGRMPVSENNIEFIPVNDKGSYYELVARMSAEADLTVMGFDMESLDNKGPDAFVSHPALQPKDVLYVHSPYEITIR